MMLRKMGQVGFEPRTDLKSNALLTEPLGCKLRFKIILNMNYIFSLTKSNLWPSFSMCRNLKKYLAPTENLLRITERILPDQNFPLAKKLDFFFFSLCPTMSKAHLKENQEWKTSQCKVTNMLRIFPRVYIVHFLTSFLVAILA